MITLLFIAFLAASMGFALMDWRKAWLLAIVCGVLQDPVRKLTPGTPVVLSMSVVAVYAAILIAAFGRLQENRREFSLRFPRIYSLVGLVVLCLVFAAINGIWTFGPAGWKAPALSLLIYLIPIAAVAFGYAWLTREEHLVSFFRFYAIVTSTALVGTVLEYLRVAAPALGIVAMQGEQIRFLPGLHVRILSGFYRAPDIMGWHAATLTAVGLVMALRAQVIARAWPWILVTCWGALNCLISGRRKAVYMVAVFAAVLLWRYFQRLTTVQLATAAALAVALIFMILRMGTQEESRVYTRAAAVASRSEVLARLEGGFTGSLRQSGFFGAGLGTATQGVRHVTGSERDFGWQEGGLGKLTVELGVPGLAVVALLAWTAIRLVLRITAYPDLPGTSQLMRVALFAMVAANVVNFLASAQAYSDPLLALITAFFVGCLFATARLDESPDRGEAPDATLAPARVLPAAAASR